ncbi:hypothetical protein [Flavihumibacter fluvii]|uniref:hypothetical protein n=1 Tax=Flavihumibacter fluvii TaxID=2838157 RepID=UPI001BDE80F2|nr:hypothetical protein [Flavihumibacter fluvii]ULQ51027.1 hypothetical protein KJS93_13130 [Flavihumibacter fluvii]
MGRFLSIILITLLVLTSGFVYWRYYWVFGEGVKAGELNYVVKKGYLFKTYEGKLIQSGFKGGIAGSIQSYEFEFSVINESIANQLMNNSGKTFDLHYTEYLGALPWRGNSKYIVDSILSMGGVSSGKVIDPKAGR